MEKNDEDLRVARSRKLMETAMIDILNSEGIKALTVKNLCENAGINRGTFYLHYRDIFHFIEENPVIQELLHVFKPIQVLEIIHLPESESIYPPIARAFDYLNQHARFFKALFHPAAPAELKEKLQYWVGTRLYEHLTEDTSSLAGSSILAEYAVAYLGNAQFAVIQHWFITNRTLPPQEIAKMLTQLIRRSPCLAM